MSKRARKDAEPVFARVDNNQKFSTLRLVPAINQKNYFTNYLKKDSQFMCRKLRERPDDDDSETVVLHFGSRNLRVGRSTDVYPKTLPFNVAKRQALYPRAGPAAGPDAESSAASDAGPDAGPDADAGADAGAQDAPGARFDDALDEVRQSFRDRMRFYKTRVVPNGSDACRQFNERQTGEPVKHDEDEDAEEEEARQAQADRTRVFCVAAAPSPAHTVFWPLVRGTLNEDPAFYRSAEELAGDLFDIVKYALQSDAGLGLPALRSGRYDAVLVVPDMTERAVLTLLVDLMFRLGIANVAIIQEAVAATYGAGISAACIVDIGAETTSVSCVDDGMCIADSRVRLDFGSDDITRAFGHLLARIAFPGSPDAPTLDALKRQFCTVNEADISVQLYKYYAHHVKYDFKVYNEVMLPVLGLFYPDLFELPPRLPWRHALFPRSIDPYSQRPNDPVSDADVHVQRGTLAVFNQSGDKTADGPTPAGSSAATDVDAGDSGDASLQLDAGDDADDIDSAFVSRDATPAPDAAALGAASEAGSTNGAAKGGDAEQPRKDTHDALDPAAVIAVPLDHAIIESISQAAKHSGSKKLYYENLLVIGGGSKIPNFHIMLTDRLVMWNQAHLKDLGEVAVMAVPRDLDPEIICWKGGSVYAKLKIIDEMWTTTREWDTLGSRTLHYKAAMYMF